MSDWSSDVCSSDLEQAWALLGTQFEERVTRRLHREVGVLRPAAGNDALSERLTGAFLRGQCDERYAAQVNLRPNALPRFLEGTGLHLNRNLADRKSTRLNSSH